MTLWRKQKGRISTGRKGLWSGITHLEVENKGQENPKIIAKKKTSTLTVFMKGIKGKAVILRENSLPTT